jgi:hypothetical protein
MTLSVSLFITESAQSLIAATHLAQDHVPAFYRLEELASWFVQSSSFVFFELKSSALRMSVSGLPRSSGNGENLNGI